MKRLFDLVVSLVALVVLAPLLLCLAIAIMVSIGHPVLFRQTRAGLAGKPFMLVKFRTMRDAYYPDGSPLPDAERLTSFGRFMRTSSLDELPELWNIVRGDMSLVGPRPLLMEYLPRYTANQARRHEVRPGLTGWAQVSGRNSLSWKEKFALDTWYVDNRTFGLDLKIMSMTALQLFRPRGISAEGSATMPVFMGEDDD